MADSMPPNVGIPTTGLFESFRNSWWARSPFNGNATAFLPSGTAPSGADRLQAERILEETPVEPVTGWPDAALTFSSQPSVAEGDGGKQFGYGPIDSVTTDIRPSAGRIPDDAAAKWFARTESQWHGPGIVRGWAASDVNWEASALHHHPLYFEEVNLERHGHAVPLVQPLISAANFYARIPALPYQMALYPPHECQFVLGHDRPGDCVSSPIRLVPVAICPTLVEAAVITGLVIALP